MNNQYDILEEALIASDTPCALVVTSIDDLNGIARNYGLRALEAVRHEFQSRLIKFKRSSDSTFRLTDDLICILIHNLEHVDHAQLAANKFESLFKKAFLFADHEISLKPSAGILYFDNCMTRDTADKLFRSAEDARATAYRDRKYCVVQTFNHHPLDTSDQFSLTNFDQALSEAKITLDYQPQYRLSDGALVGAEALVRWRTDEKIIPPDVFLPHLSHEQHWELFRYCFRQVARNRELFSQPCTIALNVDPVVLTHPEMVSFIQKDTAIWGITATDLSFEVTESVTIDNFEAAADVLNRIRDLGFSTSIDDFGTQHASFEHLRNLPADEVKIDRQFISHVVDSRDDQEIVETIIDMCHRFGKKVVAEGIEDSRVVEYLINANCDIGQGFFLGLPMSLHQFTMLLTGLAPEYKTMNS